MKNELLDDIRNALPVDGVLLDLHGAGVAEGVDNIELDQVVAIRELVGEQVPIVCALDLHGNLDPAMTDYFDAMVG